ncbi:MAG TPA: aspartyl protease family protein [Candidatus Eisenbacteria bacterium]
MSRPREGTRATGRFRQAALAAGGVLLAAVTVRADWLTPDASFRDAQMQLRYATRDTVGHADDVARLDTLGVALLRLGRVGEARTLFARTLAAKPGDPAACAALGKLALWADRLGQAESLLTLAGDVEQSRADLYATRLRRAEWNEAGSMCEELGDDGRKPLLERLAEGPPMAAQGDAVRLLFERIWPAPLIKVRLNGAPVLMMVDTGTPGLLVDPIAVRQYHVTPIAGQRLTPWTGTRVAIKNALVAKLEIGGIAFTNVPAGVLPLRKLSLEVNPQSTAVMGVIGVDVLRRFAVTFDYPRRRFEMAPLASAAGITGTRVPFELWGENELTAWGSINGGRRMAMTLATGLPEGGVGAPEPVFEELGIKSGGVSKLVKGAGTWLQGRAWAQVNVASLTLGRAAFDKLPGWSGAMEPVEMWRHGVRRDALLGPGILRGRRTTIDWAKRELVFED